MSLQNLSQNELQKILTQVNQALYNHQQWYNELVRSIACRLEPNDQDIQEKSHTLCRFGQWYYQKALQLFSKNEKITEIGKVHKEMHVVLRKILLYLNSNNEITTVDYDNFSNLLDNFRLKMMCLKTEIENLLNLRDHLTMTISRDNMLPLLREKFQLIRRSSDIFCFVMLDLDHFKKINDTYGHLAGDKVLAFISNYILTHLREGDLLFRYGGEEFLILLTHVEKHQAYKIIEMLRREIVNLKTKLDEKVVIQITVSFGITEVDPNLTIEQNIEQADKALYDAKSGGRNRVVVR